MKKRSLVIVAIVGSILILIACSPPISNNEPDRASFEIFATSYPRDIQDIQVSQGAILPPYGIRVRAEAATLTLHVTTSVEDPAERIADIQRALDNISELASESGTISLEDISLGQTSASNPNRGTPVPQIDNIVTSSVTLKLSTALAKQHNSLIESLMSFNSFLQSTSLPETITIQVVALETIIRNPEIYREQIISKVYDEVEAIKAEYGESVQFEITGLHGMPQLMKLNDIEYYIYLEPTIVVKEF
jgi:hypothetical protein